MSFPPCEENVFGTKNNLWSRWSLYKEAVSLKKTSPQKSNEILQSLGASGMIQALAHIPQMERSKISHQACRIFYESLLYSLESGANNFRIQNYDWSNYPLFEEKYFDAISEKSQTLVVQNLSQIKKWENSQKASKKYLQKYTKKLSHHPLFYQKNGLLSLEKKDWKTARDHFRKALNLGNIESIEGLNEACSHLGEELQGEEKVLFIGKNIGIGEGLFLKIGKLYQENILFPANIEKSSVYFKKGAELGGIEEQKFIAFHALSQNNFALAYPHLTGAANQEDLEAQEYLLKNLKIQIKNSIDKKVASLFQEHINLLHRQLEKHQNPKAFEILAESFLMENNSTEAYLAIERSLSLGGDRYDLRAIAYALGEGAAMNLEKAENDLKQFHLRTSEVNPQLNLIESLMKAFSFSQITSNPSIQITLMQTFKRYFPQTNLEDFLHQSQMIEVSEDEILSLFSKAINQENLLTSSLLGLLIDELRSNNRSQAYSLLLNAEEKKPLVFSNLSKILRSQILMKGPLPELEIDAFSTKKLAFSLMEELKDDPHYDPYDYAILLYEGILCEKDEETSIKYLKDSVTKGNVWAAYTLSAILLKQKDPDYLSAIEYLKLATENDISTSWGDLGGALLRLWQENNDPSLIPEFIQSCQKAIQNNDGRGYFYIGQLFLSADPSLAEEYFQQASMLTPDLHASIQKIYEKQTLDKKRKDAYEEIEAPPIFQKQSELKGTGKKILKSLEKGKKFIRSSKLISFFESLQKQGDSVIQGSGSRVRVGKKGIVLHMHFPHGKDSCIIRGKRRESIHHFLHLIAQKD